MDQFQNIVAIMRNDIEKLQKLRKECFYAPGSRQKHLNDWKEALTEYGQSCHCSDFKTLNACYKEAKKPVSEVPAERSGCLFVLILCSICFSVAVIGGMVTDPRKDSPTGCFILLFLASIAVTGMLIERYLHPKPKQPSSPSKWSYSSDYDDARFDDGVAIGYAMREHDSHKSKSSHHSAHSNETYDDGYEVGYEDGLSDYEIDVDESSEFGQGYAEGFDDGYDDREYDEEDDEDRYDDDRW